MKPRVYLQTLVSVFTRTESYVLQIKKTFWFSLRFFIISMLILGINFAIRIRIREIPQLMADVSQTIIEVQEKYPNELELSWTGLKLESNLNEPLEIPYPESWTTEDADSLPPVLAYYLPGEVNSADFADSLDKDSLIVITEGEFYLTDFRDGWSEVSLKNLVSSDELTVNKETLPGLLEQVSQFTDNTINQMKNVIFIVLPLFMIINSLVVTFFLSLLGFLLIKINNLKIGFKKTFQLSLYLVVVAETVNQIAGWLYPNIELSIFSLTFWAVFVWVMWRERRNFSKK